MNSSTVVVYKDNSLEKIRVFFDTMRLCIHENIIFLIASFAPDHRVLFQHVLKQLPLELKYICSNQSQRYYFPFYDSIDSHVFRRVTYYIVLLNKYKHVVQSYKDVSCTSCLYHNIRSDILSLQYAFHISSQLFLTLDYEIDYISDSIHLQLRHGFRCFLYIELHVKEHRQSHIQSFCIYRTQTKKNYTYAKKHARVSRCYVY